MITDTQTIQKIILQTIGSFEESTGCMASKKLVNEHIETLATLKATGESAKGKMDCLEKQNIACFTLLSKMDVKIDDIRIRNAKHDAERNMVIGCVTIISGLLGGWIGSLFGGGK